MPSSCQSTSSLITGSADNNNGLESGNSRCRHYGGVGTPSIPTTLGNIFLTDSTSSISDNFVSEYEYNRTNDRSTSFNNTSLAIDWSPFETELKHHENRHQQLSDVYTGIIY